jgi:cbb3-type cytochrome oxidase maturation protein
MTDFFYLIPVALALGAAGLGAFMWSLRNGQYDDLDGAAERILFDDDSPLTGTGQEHRRDLTATGDGSTSGVFSTDPESPKSAPQQKPHAEEAA